MLGRIRDLFEGLPAVVSYALLSLIILAAAVVIYLQIRGAPVPEGTDVTEQMIYRKCLNCGQTFEDKAKDLAAKGCLDDIEYSTLREAGIKCPACGRNSLEIANKCPNDGTVFFTIVVTEDGRPRSAKCPKCGWMP